MSTFKKNLKNAKGLGDSVAAVTKATKLDKDHPNFALN